MGVVLKDAAINIQIQVAADGRGMDASLPLRQTPGRCVRRQKPSYLIENGVLCLVGGDLLKQRQTSGVDLAFCNGIQQCTAGFMQMMAVTEAA